MSRSGLIAISITTAAGPVSGTMVRSGMSASTTTGGMTTITGLSGAGKG